TRASVRLHFVFLRRLRVARARCRVRRRAPFLRTFRDQRARRSNAIRSAFDHGAAGAILMKDRVAKLERAIAERRRELDALLASNDALFAKLRGAGGRVK